MLRYLIAGLWFGLVLSKGEVISWWRIQEMFRLQSFHMYGIIGSAIFVGALSIWLLRKFQVKSLDGAPIEIEKKKFTWGIPAGGFLFGLGWAITGACPGPLYAQVGAGLTVVTITIVGAILGTWVYGALKSRLPH